MAARVTTYLGTISSSRGRVKRLVVGTYAAEPDWSPSGRKIAFNGVRVLDLATKRVVRLHDGTHPRWSPDGRRMAFAHEHEVWVMNADGTGGRCVTGS
jgi:Tol biopolymer transport system component